MIIGKLLFVFQYILYHIDLFNTTYFDRFTSSFDNYYWLLKPYNQSYYKTSVDFDNSNIDIVFFAIRENEDLYS